jgi:GTP diphosphokinase / guanosine-3',5'-bis(diphosphate) 3'-diphosphatase
MPVEQLTLPPHEAENWGTFQKRLEIFPHRDRKDINFAYQLAKSAHRGQMRVGKDRYFEHLRAVSLILLDEVNITDPSVIKAALLHDSMEDTAVFGNPLKQSYRAWVNEAWERLVLNFGDETANMVVALTKPQVDMETFHTKEEAKSFYYEGLRNAPSKTLLVKMADRLHNLRTQYETSPEQQRKKVSETRDVYLPIFAKVRTDYPLEAEYMIGEIEKELQNLEASFI